MTNDTSGPQPLPVFVYVSVWVCVCVLRYLGSSTVDVRDKYSYKLPYQS